jgi:hypothetical protein
MQYLSLLLAGYPLAFIFARLPNATLKHMYSLLVGLWMMQVSQCAVLTPEAGTAAVTVRRPFLCMALSKCHCCPAMLLQHCRTSS